MTRFGCCCAALLILGMCTMSLAEIPQLINYQGKVTDSGGTAVPDGTYTMRFQIYNQAIGGSPLWDSGAQSVGVADGVFSILLGSTGQPTLGLEFDEDYWLLISIGGDIQTPRRRLGSVGYAYMASGLVAGTKVSGSVTSGTSAAIEAENTATAGVTYGIYSESASTSGRALYGLASSSEGFTYGVTGNSNSTDGTGVKGVCAATTGLTYGVWGQNASDSGIGVYGYVLTSAGFGIGVWGTSAATYGTGVYGSVTESTGPNYGVTGHSPAYFGTGVYGSASASTGITYGVWGKSLSDEGLGVYGEAVSTTGTNYGVYGSSASTSGVGTYGYNSALSGSTEGVYGVVKSTAGRGVVGWAQATTGDSRGVYGRSDAPSGYGVYGYSYASTGISFGVYGDCESPLGSGVTGYSPGLGVEGVTSSSTGLGVYYSGGLGGTGSKSCIVKTSQGPTFMYCQESPECWFEDFGGGQLIDGRCHIELDPLFLETVTIDEMNPLRVFIQLRGDCRGVYVEEGESGFDIIELQGGSSSAAFHYRVVAKRKGFEEKRLDYCKVAETDPYLYPEFREKQLRQNEEEQTNGEEKRSRMKKAHAQREIERARMEELRAQREHTSRLMSEVRHP